MFVDFFPFNRLRSSRASWALFFPGLFFFFFFCGSAGEVAGQATGKAGEDEEGKRRHLENISATGKTDNEKQIQFPGGNQSRHHFFKVRSWPAISMELSGWVYFYRLTGITLFVTKLLAR